MVVSVVSMNSDVFATMNDITAMQSAQGGGDFVLLWKTIFLFMIIRMSSSSDDLAWACKVKNIILTWISTAAQQYLSLLIFYYCIICNINADKLYTIILCLKSSACRAISMNKFFAHIYTSKIISLWVMSSLSINIMK